MSRQLPLSSNGLSSECTARAIVCRFLGRLRFPLTRLRVRFRGHPAYPRRAVAAWALRSGARNHCRLPGRAAAPPRLPRERETVPPASRPFIPFELVFACGVRSGSDFVSLRVRGQSLWHCLVKGPLVTQLNAVTLTENLPTEGGRSPGLRAGPLVAARLCPSVVTFS